MSAYTDVAEGKQVERWALQAMARTVNFTLRGMGSPWRVLSMTLVSDFISEDALVAVQRMD